MLVQRAMTLAELMFYYRKNFITSDHKLLNWRKHLVL